MRIIGIIFLSILLLFEYNPFKVVYELTKPSMQDQRIYFEKEIKKANLQGINFNDAEIVRNREYIILQARPNAFAERDEIIKNIIDKLYNSGWSLYRNIKYDTNEVWYVLKKNNYMCTIRIIENDIIYSFKYKDYYGVN